MKNIATAAHDFVNRHKTALTVTATATITFAACVALAQVGVRQRDEFLREHGLYDAYYAETEI